jgi:hypothetical protein
MQIRPALLPGRYIKITNMINRLVQIKTNVRTKIKNFDMCHTRPTQRLNARKFEILSKHRVSSQMACCLQQSMFCMFVLRIFLEKKRIKRYPPVPAF